MPSGWFPDPLGRHEHRYFNGATWTSDVSDAGQRRVDPFGTAPGPAPAGGPSPESSGNGAATAAVVMGSIALAIAWIPFVAVAGLVLAVLALVFGIRGLRRSRSVERGRGAAIAGIVMGGLGLAAAVVGAFLTVAVLREVIDFIEPGPVTADVTDCAVDGRRVDVSGTIENRDDETHDYTVFVEFSDGTDFATVEDLGPGETAVWDTTVRTRSIPTECDPNLIVHGSFPFGVEVDPVD